MKRLRFWPQRLVGQITLVLMLAVALEFVGSSLLVDRMRIGPSREIQVRRAADQLAAAEALLEEIPAADRPARSLRLSTREVQLSWSELPPLVHRDRPIENELRDQFLNSESVLRSRELRLAADPVVRPGSLRVSAAARMSDGSWLVLRTGLSAGPWSMLLSGVGSAFILGLGVVAVSALVLRNLNRPLRALAEAADKVGQGRPVRIAVTGAGDLKRVTNAFNSMQERISGLLRARTQALAAVGHDLRTPLARVRLRAGFVQDEAIREAMESDVDEMTGMLDSLLAYLGGQEDPELPRRMDLAALAATVADTAADEGRPVSYEGPDHLPLHARPLSLKRAINNLVENALHYGGVARILLRLEGQEAVLTVEDDGPGVPDDQLGELFQPFHRLDLARARNTSGLGLGLTIVQQVVVREGGQVTLGNRPAGGFEVELRLPAV